jgi:hypothetical protein
VPEKRSVSAEECHLGYCNPFSLCFATISTFAHFIHSFLARHGGRVPIPSIRVPSYLPLILFISKYEFVQPCRILTLCDRLSVQQEAATSVLVYEPIDRLLPISSYLSFFYHDMQPSCCLLLIHEKSLILARETRQWNLAHFLPARHHPREPIDQQLVRKSRVSIRVLRARDNDSRPICERKKKVSTTSRRPGLDDSDRSNLRYALIVFAVKSWLTCGYTINNICPFPPSFFRNHSAPSISTVSATHRVRQSLSPLSTGTTSKFFAPLPSCFMRRSMYVQYPFPDPTSTTPLPFATTLMISSASKLGHTQLK